MPSRTLLVAVCSTLSLSAAFAQSQPGTDYFLRRSASGLRSSLALPIGLTPALPTAAPVPTGWAATPIAPYTLVKAPAAPLTSPLPVETGQPRDLTGSRGFPVYDPLQNLPEFYRQHTLPEARIEPWPVQLLRGILTP